jgi:hypothetical protein
MESVEIYTGFKKGKAEKVAGTKNVGKKGKHQQEVTNQVMGDGWVKSRDRRNWPPSGPTRDRAVPTSQITSERQP